MQNNCGFPIELVQGTDFSWQITYTDPDGNPIDLSGYTAEMQVRQTINSNDPPLMTASTGNGYIAITAASGLITISVPNAITQLIPAPLKAWYDLVLTSGVGVKTRLIFGQVTIPELVTR